MSTKLYVGGLNYSTTEDTLRKAFEAAGTVVSASVIIDRDTNRSRGFGFVEMATAEEAQNAINMFDNKDLEGRTLRVNESRPLEARPPRRDFGGARGGNGGGGFGGRRDSAPRSW